MHIFFKNPHENMEAAGKGWMASTDGEDARVEFGPDRVKMQCPKCSVLVWSRVETKESVLAWIICGILFMSACWLRCHLLPCLLDRFKDVQHDYPNCEAFLSSSRRCHRGEHTILFVI